MIKTIIDKTKDKFVKVICQNCKNITKHQVVISVNEEGEEKMTYEDHNYYWQNDYEIIQCLGCEVISFRSEHSNSEDMDYEEGPYIIEHIYPKRNKDTWQIKNFYNVPHNLSRIYRETIDCYNSESLTLCGAGTRALVEGICKENGILDGEIKITLPDGTLKIKRSKDLQGKINGLFEKGKLTEQNAEILHEHRFLGNTSIHELSIPSKEELALAIEIVENVFDTLYEIPQKALELKRKRMAKKK